MKLYIIPAWYPHNEQDITAIFFRQQAQALARRGHDVTVLHIEPISITNAFRSHWHDRRVWQDGRVRTIFYKVIVPIPGKFANIQEKYISGLYYKIIKQQILDDQENGQEAPEVLHAHVSHSCAYYCLKAADKLKLPLVVTEHYSGLLLGTATEREYRRVKDTIEKSDSFIFVGSNFQKTICEKLRIEKKTYVIPNLAESCLFEEVPRKDNKHEVFTFLVACHLTKNKSVDNVIKAFHQAFSGDENLRLVIAGDGEEFDSLRALTVELEEESRVHFRGRYLREESKELYSSANAFVLTSKVETFGIVYIESMSCGLPCIGTKGQGADDIIDETNGLLVSYGDLEELSVAMRTLYENSAKYNPQVIRESCKRRFSEDTVCQMIEENYRNIKE